MAADVLVLDGDRKHLEACEHALITLGYQPIVTADLENAHRVLKSQRPALLLIDVLSLAGRGSELALCSSGAFPGCSSRLNGR